MSSRGFTFNSMYPAEREERIAARRARIASRMEQKNQQLLDQRIQKVTSSDSLEAEKSKSQISASVMDFKSVLEAGIEEVASVKAWLLQREEVRVLDQKKRNVELVQKKDEEQKQSESINSEINERWGIVSQKNVPEELYQAIKQVRSTCEDVINSKESLIREYQTDAKSREEEYVKMINKQAEEIEELITKMRAQYKLLAASYENELIKCEDAFAEERKILKKQNAEEIDQLYDERRAKEVRFSESKQEKDEESRMQINALQVMEGEEYNELKIKLETEIQALEQHLQVMKATFQLNHEKLSHNFRLLEERAFEHTQEIQKQKKKINRFTDQVSTLKAKYEKTDKKYRQKNSEMTEEYKRTTDQYKDLQSTFKISQERDQKKYRDVWRMNEERVATLVKRLLQADKTISEQQLGFLWFPPTEDVFALKATEKVNLTPNKQILVPSMPRENAFLPEHRKEILQLICDEAEFLVEERVKAMLGDLPVGERNMIEINSIMGVLGIESASAAEVLISYFVKPREEGELWDGETEWISPTEAVSALKKFAKDHQVKIKEVSIENLTSTEEEKQEKAQHMIEKEYWDRLASVVPERSIQSWDMLEKELLKYNRLLSDRSNLLKETDSIRKQNDELKVLLGQYLHSKINEELIVPAFGESRT